MKFYADTTSDEDRQCKDLIGEAFEEAVREGEQEGCPFCGKQFPILGNIDLDVLWEKICTVLGVAV